MLYLADGDIIVTYYRNTTQEITHTGNSMVKYLATQLPKTACQQNNCVLCIHTCNSHIAVGSYLLCSCML